MAWNYVPPGEYTAGYWVDNSTPGYPLVSYTDPTQGFDNRNAALESLYIPTAGGRMDQVASLIAQKPEEYAKYGITPQNAADTVNSTFYDRINNIDNDPLNFLNNLAFLPHAMGLANIFTGGGVDSFLNNTFGSGSGPVASGGNPEMVAGWEWSADPRFTGTTVDGVLQNSGNPNWWQTDWGTEGLVDSSWTTDPRFNGTTVDFTTTRVGSGVNMNDYYSMLDDIQAGTNGVTAPSPTMSVPGYGDVYGSPSTILKSLVGSGMSPTNAMSMLQKALGGDTSALSALGGALSGSGSNSIWDMFTKLLPAGLGMYASNQQANKLSELAQKYQDYGAPYRQQLADISANPDNFYNSLGAQKATDAVLNKLSIGGNPAGSANKQALTIDSLYDQYGKERDRLAGFGGLTNYNQAAPNLEAQAIGANANMWNAAGAGLNDIFNPKTSLADLLKQGKIV